MPGRRTERVRISRTREARRFPISRGTDRGGHGTAGWAGGVGDTAPPGSGRRTIAGGGRFTSRTRIVSGKSTTVRRPLFVATVDRTDTLVPLVRGGWRTLPHPVGSVLAGCGCIAIELRTRPSTCRVRAGDRGNHGGRRRGRGGRGRCRGGRCFDDPRSVHRWKDTVHRWKDTVHRWKDTIHRWKDTITGRTVPGEDGELRVLHSGVGRLFRGHHRIDGPRYLGTEPVQRSGDIPNRGEHLVHIRFIGSGERLTGFVLAPPSSLRGQRHLQLCHHLPNLVTDLPKRCGTSPETLRVDPQRSAHTALLSDLFGGGELTASHALSAAADGGIRRKSPVVDTIFPERRTDPPKSPVQAERGQRKWSRGHPTSGSGIGEITGPKTRQNTARARSPLVTGYRLVVVEQTGYLRQIRRSRQVG